MAVRTKNPYKSRAYVKARYAKGGKSGRHEHEDAETVAIAYPEDSQLKLRFLQSSKYGDRVYIVVEDAKGNLVNKFYLDMYNAAELLKILARFIVQSKSENYLLAVLRKVIDIPAPKKEEAGGGVEHISASSDPELKKKMDDMENALAALTSKVAGLSAKIDNLTNVIEAFAKSMPPSKGKKR